MLTIESTQKLYRMKLFMAITLMFAIAMWGFEFGIPKISTNVLRIGNMQSNIIVSENYSTKNPNSETTKGNFKQENANSEEKQTNEILVNDSFAMYSIEQGDEKTKTQIVPEENTSIKEETQEPTAEPVKQPEPVEKTIVQKLESLEISESLDMSKPIGLTEDEIRYLLQEFSEVQDENIIEILPRVMVQTVQEYPVNELASISVMSLESGFFTSDLAINKYNYGGMLGSSGKWMKFENMEEGLKAAIKCFYNNLKGNNTIREVNTSYCPAYDMNGDNQVEEWEKWYWSDSVLEIMEWYKSTVS